MFGLNDDKQYCSFNNVVLCRKFTHVGGVWNIHQTAPCKTAPSNPMLQVTRLRASAEPLPLDASTETGNGKVRLASCAAEQTPVDRRIHVPTIQ